MRSKTTFCHNFCAQENISSNVENLGEAGEFL